MVSLRVGVVVLIACGACGAANSGSEGNVVASHGEGGSPSDGATRDASSIPQDAGDPDAGAHSAGPPEAGLDAGPPVTWSGIYQTLLVNQSYPSNCTGASCHDPGIEKGLDLSTPHTGYTTISHRLVPGSPDSSELVTVLQSGSMPEKRPRMAAADIDLIRAWIQAGAPEN
jgi:hypothetical protein